MSGAGASVKYIQANRSGHLEHLISSYGMEHRNDSYFYEGVSYQLKENDESVNFIIYDLGTTNTNAILSNQAIDLLVMVCGSKPYETQFTCQRQNELKEKRAYLLFPFVQDEMKPDIIDAFRNEYHEVIFLEYQPEQTDGMPNQAAFINLISKYITGA